MEVKNLLVYETLNLLYEMTCIDSNEISVVTIKRGCRCARDGIAEEGRERYEKRESL